MGSAIQCCGGTQPLQLGAITANSFEGGVVDRRQECRSLGCQFAGVSCEIALVVRGIVVILQELGRPLDVLRF